MPTWFWPILILYTLLFCRIGKICTNQSFRIIVCNTLCWMKRICIKEFLVHTWPWFWPDCIVSLAVTMQSQPTHPNSTKEEFVSWRVQLRCHIPNTIFVCYVVSPNQPEWILLRRTHLQELPSIFGFGIRPCSTSMARVWVSSNSQNEKRRSESKNETSSLSDQFSYLKAILAFTRNWTRFIVIL